MNGWSIHGDLLFYVQHEQLREMNMWLRTTKIYVVLRLLIGCHLSPRSTEKRQLVCACSVKINTHSGKMSPHAQRISGFRGAISDSGVGEVCWRANRTSFYTFWDWYWCDPTGKILNGVCSYGKVWWVSRIIIDIVQLKPIEIYLDSSLRVPVPITNFIYKTHFIIGICSVHALNLKAFRCKLLW